MPATAEVVVAEEVAAPPLGSPGDSGTLAEGPLGILSLIAERAEPKGKAPIEVVNLSGSNDGARSVGASEGASHRSTLFPSEDAQKVMDKLPLLAPFFAPRPSLRELVEPLTQVCRVVGDTDLVAEVSRLEGVDLGIALEWAAYQFIVLARSATTSYDNECDHLKDKAANLRYLLADSQEKASNLEDALQQEQGRWAAFEVEAKNVQTKWGALVAEVQKLQAQKAILEKRTSKLTYSNSKLKLSVESLLAERSKCDGWWSKPWTSFETSWSTSARPTLRLLPLRTSSWPVD
ncbi:hypothetical protein GUJ93_ZPchr0006g45250 [Zizania palustris]|uniref:Uncharacterized protein n=1 Tax=Zizania palustris TaxID=103762 RepID=A0A8J5W1A9_ZIZPA|nr:hypothetical protein GUJ93_ZPchr0006g45250 [Zizania palustris]